MISMPHVSIIILNWNGWSDTIECLETVLKSDYQNINIVLVDNASNDGSVNKIFEWAKSQESKSLETSFDKLVYPLIPKPVKIHEIKPDHKMDEFDDKISKLKKSILNREMVFIQNDENLGFAIANNIAIKSAKYLFNSEYFYILNNDTVIEKNSISKIIRWYESFKKTAVISSAIYYYDHPNKVSNFGGKINIWGNRKYFTNIKKNTVIQEVSFVTGCALMIPTVIIDQYGYFTEKFFFGEEDFELSLRLKKSGIDMYCLTESKVFHKISVASRKLLKDDLQQKLIYFLNRIINLKEYYPYYVWKVWRLFMILYSGIWLTTKYSVNMKISINFIRQLYYYSNILNDVQKDAIENIQNNVSF
jgi:GT2 family glycosyltransferase